MYPEQNSIKLKFRQLMQKGISSYQKKIPMNPSPGNGVLGAKFIMADIPMDLNCDLVKTTCVVAHLKENLMLIPNCLRTTPLKCIVFEHSLNMRKEAQQSLKKMKNFRLNKITHYSQYPNKSSKMFLSSSLSSISSSSRWLLS